MDRIPESTHVRGRTCSLVSQTSHQGFARPCQPEVASVYPGGKLRKADLGTLDLSGLPTSVPLGLCAEALGQAGPLAALLAKPHLGPHCLLPRS